MTNIDHHSASVLRKFDGIDYCDFHDHGITIISMFCPTLHNSRQGLSHFVTRAQVIPCYQWLPQAKGGTTQQRNHKILPGRDFMSCLSWSLFIPQPTALLPSLALWEVWVWLSAHLHFSILLGAKSWKRALILNLASRATGRKGQQALYIHTRGRGRTGLDLALL